VPFAMFRLAVYTGFPGLLSPAADVFRKSSLKSPIIISRLIFRRTIVDHVCGADIDPLIDEFLCATRAVLYIGPSLCGVKVGTQGIIDHFSP
jgi:hypothetical protein